MRSNYLPLPSDVKWRRLAAVVLFLGILYGLRELAPVFICFVFIVRSLTVSADFVHDRTGIERRGGVASLLLVGVSGLAAAIFIGVREVLPRVHEIRAEGRELLEHLLEQPVVDRLRHMAGGREGAGGGAGETIKEHALEALHYATAFAHLALYLVIGFILSVIYLFERDEIDHWRKTLEPESVSGTMVRWLGYVGDAVAITVKMQGVTALVNAVITFPILVVLGLPHKLPLFILILVSGLLPVVGNFIAGGVLTFVAYETRGLWAVGVMLGLTFVLHKIESYYLTPRLAAKHVKLPGLVLVLSLLTFEEVFGFVGLFLSFPALYIATQIHREWKVEDAPKGVVSELEPDKAAAE
jgi:predicted PurR-regulated permease PerM